MQIKKIGFDLLKENEWNPNLLTEIEFSKLVRQIKRFGMRQPILVRPKNDFFEIIDGAHRARASKQAGLKEIDCIVMELSDTEAKASTIAMNKLRGHMDDVSLAKLLEDLKEKLSGEELSDLSSIEEEKIKVFLKLLEFPDNYAKMVKSPDAKEITATFILTEKQFKTVEQALALVDKSNKSFSLLHICNFFISHSKPS